MDLKVLISGRKIGENVFRHGVGTDIEAVFDRTADFFVPAWLLAYSTPDYDLV